MSYHDRILHDTGFATRPRADVQDACLQIASEADQQIADLQSKLLAQEAAVADVWNAEREELQLRAEVHQASCGELAAQLSAAEAKIERENAKLREACETVLAWYDRDGSVGGACDPMEALRAAIAQEVERE